MQIVPVTGASWSNAAAAQQAASDSHSGTVRPNAAEAVRMPGIGDVERSSETLDRDANGQYDGGPGQRRPQDSETNQASDTSDKTSFLDLPAIGPSSELDLMG